MTTDSTARLKRAAAGTIATAVAISAFGIAATPAIAAPSTVRVHISEFGEEGDTYPANKWFFGGSDHVNTGGMIVNDQLVLQRKTQVLTELKGGELPDSVAEIIDEGLAVDVADDSDGGAGLQIALGWQGGWTTLRPKIDVPTADVDDIWISSRAIPGAESQEATLGELADAIDASADGSFAYAAVGVFADAVFEEGETDTTTTVDSITVNDATYTFASGLPAVANTTKVQLSEIGDETEAGYPDAPWFFGTNVQFPEAAAGATVRAGNLVLKPKTQLLTELTGVTSLRSVAANGLAVTTTAATDGDATLQITAGWDGGWATLRPAAAVKGENVAEFDADWISSRPLTDGVTTGTLDELVTIIDAAADGTFDYVAVGAFADVTVGSASTTISSFQVGAEKTTFANDPTVTVNSVSIAGTPKVGSVLTASYTANYPGTTATYKWLRDGKAIKGATASSYRLVAADLKTKTSVTVTVAKSGISKKTSKTSAKTAAVVSGSLAYTTAPAVVGVAQVGTKLTVARAAVGVGSETAASSYSYQWLSDGATIKSATKSYYYPVFADLGKEISVRVTAKLTGYTSLVATSAVSADVIEGVFTTKTPTVSGTVKVGKTLTAKAGTWNGAPSFKYSWYADGELVQLSSSNTLKLTWEHKGAVITVTVTGTQQGYVKAVSAPSTGTVTVK
jgi:hypothetical protein